MLAACKYYLLKLSRARRSLPVPAVLAEHARLRLCCAVLWFIITNTTNHALWFMRLMENTLEEESPWSRQRIAPNPCHHRLLEPGLRSTVAK